MANLSQDGKRSLKMIICIKQVPLLSALRFNQQRFADELLAYLEGVLKPATLPGRLAA